MNYYHEQIFYKQIDAYWTSAPYLGAYNFAALVRNTLQYNRPFGLMAYQDAKSVVVGDKLFSTLETSFPKE